MMAAGGAFASSGDFSIWVSAGAALSGAVLGDQTGYFLGQFSTRWLSKPNPKFSKARILLTKAEKLLEGRVAAGIFFSRWLFSPLGPYVNVLVGTGSTPWLVFTFWGFAGEIVWVSIYSTLGFVFFAQLSELTSTLTDLSGLATGLLLSLLLGQQLWRRVHKH